MDAPLITEAVLNDEAALKSILETIQSNMNRDTTVNAYYTLSAKQEAERHTWLPEVEMASNGVKHNYLINRDFLTGHDYVQLQAIGEKLKASVKAGAIIERDSKKSPVKHFAAAMQWLMTEAKKGQSIQRYKGLGEMNPDQLWETTMDPERRCLLQVKVEDAIAADQMFTTLMGDEVEPRRQFIETNALEVINLDV